MVYCDRAVRGVVDVFWWIVRVSVYVYPVTFFRLLVRVQQVKSGERVRKRKLATKCYHPIRLNRLPSHPRAPKISH